MRNTWQAYKGVFTLHIRTSDGWKKHRSRRVDSGTSLTSTFNIAEGTRVAITACMEAAMFGCAGNIRLVA